MTTKKSFGFSWMSGLAPVLIYGLGGVLISIHEGWESFSSLMILLGVGLGVAYASILVRGIVMVRDASRIRADTGAHIIVKTTRIKPLEVGYSALTRYRKRRLPPLVYIVASEAGLDLRCGWQLRQSGRNPLESDHFYRT